MIERIYQSKTDPKQFYIPLPENMQRSTGDTPCSCGKPGCKNTWDTLAIYIDPLSRSKAWTVHFPDLEQSDLVYSLR